MIYSFLKKQRKSRDRDRDRHSPPGSPDSFYSPHLERYQEDHSPPPLPPLPSLHSATYPSTSLTSLPATSPVPSASSSAAFPYGTRIPWPMPQAPSKNQPPSQNKPQDQLQKQQQLPQSKERLGKLSSASVGPGLTRGGVKETRLRANASMDAAMTGTTVSNASNPSKALNPSTAHFNTPHPPKGPHFPNPSAGSTSSHPSSAQPVPSVTSADSNSSPPAARSPELQLDLGFTSESLLDGFPGLLERGKKGSSMVTRKTAGPEYPGQGEDRGNGGHNTHYGPEAPGQVGGSGQGMGQNFDSSPPTHGAGQLGVIQTQTQHLPPDLTKPTPPTPCTPSSSPDVGPGSGIGLSSASHFLTQSSSTSGSASARPPGSGAVGTTSNTANAPSSSTFLIRPLVSSPSPIESPPVGAEKGIESPVPSGSSLGSIGSSPPAGGLRRPPPRLSKNPTSPTSASSDTSIRKGTFPTGGRNGTSSTRLRNGTSPTSVRNGIPLAAGTHSNSPPSVRFNPLTARSQPPSGLSSGSPPSTRFPHSNHGTGSTPAGPSISFKTPTHNDGLPNTPHALNTPNSQTENSPPPTTTGKTQPHAVNLAIKVPPLSLGQGLPVIIGSASDVNATTSNENANASQSQHAADPSQSSSTINGHTNPNAGSISNLPAPSPTSLHVPAHSTSSSPSSRTGSASHSLSHSHGHAHPYQHAHQSSPLQLHPANSCSPSDPHMHTRSKSRPTSRSSSYSYTSSLLLYTDSAYTHSYYSDGGDDRYDQDGYRYKDEYGYKDEQGNWIGDFEDGDEGWDSDGSGYSYASAPELDWGLSPGVSYITNVPWVQHNERPGQDGGEGGSEGDPNGKGRGGRSGESSNVGAGAPFDAAVGVGASPTLVTPSSHPHLKQRRTSVDGAGAGAEKSREAVGEAKGISAGSGDSPGDGLGRAGGVGSGSRRGGRGTENTAGEGGDGEGRTGRRGGRRERIPKHTRARTSERSGDKTEDGDRTRSHTRSRSRSRPPHRHRTHSRPRSRPRTTRLAHRSGNQPSMRARRKMPSAAARNSHRLTRQDSATLPFDPFLGFGVGGGGAGKSSGSTSHGSGGTSVGGNMNGPGSGSEANGPGRRSRHNSDHRPPPRRGSEHHSEHGSWGHRNSGHRNSQRRHSRRSSKHSRKGPGSVGGSAPGSRSNSPGVSASFGNFMNISPRNPMPEGAAELVKASVEATGGVSSAGGANGRSLKKLPEAGTGRNLLPVLGSAGLSATTTHPNGDRSDAKLEDGTIGGVSEKQMTEDASTVESTSKPTTLVMATSPSESMPHTPSSFDSRNRARDSDMITLEDVLTGRSGYGSVNDFRDSADMRDEGLSMGLDGIARRLAAWEGNSTSIPNATENPPHATSSATTPKTTPSQLAATTSHRPTTPPYVHPFSSRSSLMASQSAQPALGANADMGWTAGNSADHPGSGLGLSLGRNLSADAAIGRPAVGDLGGKQMSPQNPLGDRLEERTQNPTSRLPANPPRQLLPNPDDGGSGGNAVSEGAGGREKRSRSGSASGGSITRDVNGVNVNGGKKTPSPSRSSPGYSGYPVQQISQVPQSPQPSQSSHISKPLLSTPLSTEQQHPNIPSKPIPETQRRDSSAPSIASGGASFSESGTPDASSSQTFDPSTSVTSLGSAPLSGASPGVRNESPGIRNGSPGMLSAGPGIAPSIRSASPAGGKFIHPPRPLYSPWMNKSSGDVSQTRTQTPPAGSDTGVGQQMGEVRVSQAQVHHFPTTPNSVTSSSSALSAGTVGMQGPGTAGGSHGPGVRRISVNQVLESPGTSPSPVNRISRASIAGATQSLGRGTLPIGTSNNNKTPATVVEKLQQRARANNESKRESSSSPLDALFDEAFVERGAGARLHRNNTVDSVAFPQTPHEFSPLLSPSFEISGLPVHPSSILSMPNHRMMPKPPLIDPPPPPKRRTRPPLPTGPRKPPARPGKGKLSGFGASRTGIMSPGLMHEHSSSSSASSLFMSNMDAGGVETLSNGSCNGTPSKPQFRARPVRWRGLTMDAAKWTFTSEQLQDIVGRAICQSAEASSIRLLTLDVLDNEIPAEMKRLELLRDEIESKYRRIVQRRRVIFRTLTLHVEGSDAQTNLLQELLEVSITCDQLTEELFHVMDELQQLNTLRDVHSASALAMALRKLNSAFVKESADLKEMRNHMRQLEAERDEGWAVAERTENELHELQTKIANGESAPSLSSNRSSRVSAARKASIRASKASLRFSRGARSSHSSTSSQQYSAHVSFGLPPVPPVPRIAYTSDSQKLALNTDLPSASSSSPYTVMSSTFPNSPTAESRALVEAQNELYKMLGITGGDLRRQLSGRHRPVSEIVSPCSLPGSPLPSSAAPLSSLELVLPLGRPRNASFSGRSRPANSAFPGIVED